MINLWRAWELLVCRVKGHDVAPECRDCCRRCRRCGELPKQNAV